MSVTVKSLTERGSHGLLVDIECHITNGLPAIVIVGFASKAIEEAKERMRGALASSKLQMPKKRVTLNLAPADIPKDSASYDVALAAAILMASGQCLPLSSDSLVFGELSLDGSVRAVRGIIGKLRAARHLGFSTFFIPEPNLSQAQLIPHITLLPLRNLTDLYRHCNGLAVIAPIHTNNGMTQPPPVTGVLPDFQDIIGQNAAKRALEIAAAGAHNVLLYGPPGTGKSLLAKAIPSVMPPLTNEEMLEVTHVHSLTANHSNTVVSQRPFRSPHHSASTRALIGGGPSLAPGEISLSHRGVLFLDEIPEFSRQTLEALRQPLEDRHITISHIRDTVTFPAHCMLVATSNPCPCGYNGSSHVCRCEAYDILRYQRKLSGPITDRIDMHVEVGEVDHTQLLAKKQSSETSYDIRARVIIARQRQSSRFSSTSFTNSDLSNRQLKQLIKLSPEAKTLLDQAADRLKLSARAYMRSLKVAQTIADLAESDTIELSHITEALQFRARVHIP